MRKPAGLTGLTLGCFAACLLAACQNSQVKGRPTQAPPGVALPVVKVAINTWPGLGPFYVAHAKGFDAQEGITLQVIMTENTEARTSSLVSGEVDLVGITLDNIVISRSRGLPMVVVGKSDISWGGDGIIANSEIKSVADLKGKRVACPEGLPSHFLLLYLLRANGLRPSDIRFIPAGDGGQAAFLFTSGNADAAVTWDPWISRTRTLTQGHVLLTTRDIPELLLGIVAANQNFLPARADRITRAMRAWFKGVAYTQSHPEEASAIMAREFNVQPDEFRRMATGARLTDLDDTQRTFGTASNPGPIRQLALDASELWMASGVIKRPVAPNDVIDWTIVNQLRRHEA
jgi:NitT/TauT family transport system substrate-binding protein